MHLVNFYLNIFSAHICSVFRHTQLKLVTMIHYSVKM